MANSILLAFEYGKAVGLQLNPKKSAYLSATTKKEDSDISILKISKERHDTYLGLDIKISATNLVKKIKKKMRLIKNGLHGFQIWWKRVLMQAFVLSPNEDT